MTERFTYRVDDAGYEARLADEKLKWNPGTLEIITKLGEEGELSEPELKYLLPQWDSAIPYALGDLMRLGCIVRIDNHDDAA